MGLLSGLFKASTFTVIKPDFGFSTPAINRNIDLESDLITTVITCEKVLSETLSKLPLEIYKQDPKLGKVKFKEHYLYKLLHSRPNSYTTATSFIGALEKNRNHRGNSFAKIHRNEEGKVTAFEFIDPKYVTGYKLKNGQLYFYYKEEGKKGEVINNDQLLHFKFLSEDGLFGMNPLKVLSYELDNIFQGKNTLNHSYKNNLNIDKVLESQISNFNTTQTKQAVADLKEEYAGSMNSKKIPVLPAGFKLVAAPTSSIQDAQILESINFSKKDIAALYGVPSYTIGIDSTSASIEQQVLQFKVNTLQYIAQIYRQELEAKLLTDQEIAEGVSIEFNTDALVAVDYTTKVNGVINQVKAGLMTPNEANRILGNQMMEQNGDYHYVQMQSATPLEKLDEFLPLLMAKNSQLTAPKNKNDGEEENK